MADLYVECEDCVDKGQDWTSFACGRCYVEGVPLNFVQAAPPTGEEESSPGDRGE